MALTEAQLRTLIDLPDDEIRRRLDALDPPAREEIKQAARDRIEALRIRRGEVELEQARLREEMAELERQRARLGELPVQEGMHVVEGKRRHG